MTNKLKKTARLFYQVGIAAWTHCYYLIRFISAANLYIDNADRQKRGFHLVRMYHALEKSMSFSRQRPNAGAAAVNEITETLAVSTEAEPNFFESVARDVLNKFAQRKDRSSDVVTRKGSARGGVIKLSHAEFVKGQLDNPELFFNSRYSLREYSDRVVPNEIVSRAVSLALKTPSVCNRQEWVIYHTTDESVIEKALSLQSGNRGFGDKVRNLAVIATDLKAFVQGNEAYQQWIDGGMFAMSFVYALHSLGIGSCCLNWSQSPSADRKLRDSMSIDYHHSIIMMIAFGFPTESNVVCASDRRPACEVLRALELNKRNRRGE